MKFFKLKFLSEIFWLKFFEWIILGEILWVKFFEWNFLNKIFWVKFSEWKFTFSLKKTFLPNLFFIKIGEKKTKKNPNVTKLKKTQTVTKFQKSKLDKNEKIKMW